MSTFNLRPLSATDAQRIADLIGDWDVVRWLSMPPYPYHLTDAQEFLARAATETAEVSWARHEAITVDGQFAGLVGIDKRSVGPNLGFWLGKPFWGRGIMTAAATRLTREFFDSSDEPLLTSGYFTGNEPSRGIQRRLGFMETGNNSLFNRPHGKHLPHVETVLTRARFETMSRV